tara:strand:+ start:559 stop:870 length:312 start_codon:yes stop_codon:yes gene_type:complete
MHQSAIDALESYIPWILSQSYTSKMKPNTSYRIYFKPHGKYYSRVATITPPLENSKYTLDYCKIKERGTNGCRWTKEKKYDTLSNLFNKIKKIGKIHKIEEIT